MHHEAADKVRRDLERLTIETEDLKRQLRELREEFDNHKHTIEEHETDFQHTDR